MTKWAQGRRSATQARFTSRASSKENPFPSERRVASHAASVPSSTAYSPARLRRAISFRPIRSGRM